MPCVHDANLRMTLEFGIGIHHAGLHESDRVLVERLYVEQKIQVLVATATLAWGVNYPAHLVIVKGICLLNPTLSHILLRASSLPTIYLPAFDCIN